jgi:diphthamide biosynthesis enzyme Dph1/Dph2-like protein
MQVFYSEIFRKAKLNNDISGLLKLLPKKFFIAYVIQYKNLAHELKNKLENKFDILGFKQVLGCSKIGQQDTILLVGGGKFHALNLLKYAKRVIVFNGEQTIELDAKDKTEIEKAGRARFSQFLHANNIGMLVSTKKGQFNLEAALHAKKTLESKFSNKKFNIFMFETLSYSEFENFPVDFWINFSCPGIEYDHKRIINLDTLESFLKKK